MGEVKLEEARERLEAAQHLRNALEEVERYNELGGEPYGFVSVALTDLRTVLDALSAPAPSIPAGWVVAAPPGFTLETILAWYAALPPGARAKLSLHNLHTLAKALAAAPSPVVEGGWRTIESAPKDGRQVLLWFPGLPTNELQRGQWREYEPSGWSPGDWINSETGDVIETVGGPIDPTHWQPLPAAPVAPAQGVTGGAE